MNNVIPSAEQLVEKARQLTGIDLEDAAAKEPLEKLVTSLNTEAMLRPDGARQMGKRILRLLANRLRMERDYRHFSEIEQQRIIAPIFIPSLPRTGSTKLQKLLCSMEEFTTLTFWMGHCPSLITGDRDEGREPRVAESQEHECWLDDTVPEAKAIHWYQTFEPEEPNPLNGHSLLSHYFAMFVEVPSYTEWLLHFDPDVTKQLAYMKRMLKYLQWQFGISDSKPWVIKNSGFLGHDLSILKVFADARLIMSHRNPVDIIPSAMNLMITFHRLYSDIDIKASMTRSMLEGQAFLISRHLENKIKHGLAVLDLGYSEISANGCQSVRKIFDFIGMLFNGEHETIVAAFERSRPKNQFGRHRYSLESFSFTQADVKSAFDRYTRLYAEFLA
jgi:Sulfotransferase family